MKPAHPEHPPHPEHPEKHSHAKGPKLGDQVLYVPALPAQNEAPSTPKASPSGQPLVAVVTHVNDDGTVNLVVWDGDGHGSGLQNVVVWSPASETLLGGGFATVPGDFPKWQGAQADAAEALAAEHAKVQADADAAQAKADAPKSETWTKT